jgi:hypothetical protein
MKARQAFGEINQVLTRFQLVIDALQQRKT